jgi:arabinogalactan oligomer / maltooligosaccharide transport system substrate-binding protein
VKRSTRRWAAAVPALALILAACGGSDEPAPAAPAPAPAPAPAAPGAPLIIWADDTRAPVIRPFAEAFAAAEGIEVEVLEVAFDQIRDLIAVQGPAGEGPDVFIGAHDWVGQLAADGVVEPLDLGSAADDFLEVAVQAFAYEGRLYGLPYSIENIALIRNTALAPQRPATVEQMIEVGLASVAAGDADIAVGWQQPDVYHAYWLVTAAGGYVFGQDASGSYDAGDVGIDSAGSLRAAEVFADMVRRDFINADINYDVMRDSFASGRAPFAITGPWAVGDFSGVDFVIEPLPSVDGGTAAPFVGVQGFMISAFAKNPVAAKAFVVDFMGSTDAQLELYKVGNRPPALKSALAAVSGDALVAGFGAAGANGRPMPNIPEMGSVWSAWTDAYTNILNGGDAATAFREAATQVRNLIG